MSEHGRPSTAAARGGAPRLLRNWRLRTKLVVLLVVPLLLAGVLGAVQIANTARTASDLGAVVARIGLAQQVSALVDALELERTAATAFVATGRGSQDGLRAQFGRVDEAAAPILRTRPADFGAGAASVANAALVRLGGVPQIRTAVTDTRYQTDAVLSTYTGVIDSLLALHRAALAVQDGQLLREAEDLTAIGQAKEQVRLQHAALVPAMATGRALATEQSLVRSTDAQLAANLARFRASGQPEFQQLYDRVVGGVEVDNRERLEQGALVAFTLDEPVTGGVDAWNAAAGRTADLMRQVQVEVEQRVRSDASAMASTASNDLTLNVLAVVIGVLLTVAVLVLVARSMIRPLQTLRTAAFDVAQHRLPEAIERMRDTGSTMPRAPVQTIGMDTDEEIGEVARAFDAVHTEAVRLAGEQAMLRANINDIFVNLSRRSQALVKRQLRLIDRLESDEQDPDHLDDLFQLDHLATRMRRNNENLLVLAGAAEQRPRRRRPVTAEDVLRAAVSEVEQYQRIVVRRAPRVSVAGPAVNDLVHLMAELLDNATQFSSAPATVVLSSSVDESGALVIEIADSGSGIDAEPLRVINSELAEPPAVDAAVSRRMGLFVVGRLARRNDIRVRLRPAGEGATAGGAGGTVAVVTVPAALVLTPAQAAAADRAAAEARPAAGPPSTGPVPLPRAPVGPPETAPVPQVPSTPLAGEGTVDLFEAAEDDAGTTAPGETRPSDGGEPADVPALRLGAASWGPMDDGWRAAREFTELTRQFLTETGLPKLRDGDHPLPGAMAELVSVVPCAPRDPDVVRGRLREYQRGLRDGRDARGEHEMAEQSGDASG